jgi:hypothetical protein
MSDNLSSRRPKIENIQVMIGSSEVFRGVAPKVGHCSCACSVSSPRPEPLHRRAPLFRSSNTHQPSPHVVPLPAFSLPHLASNLTLHLFFYANRLRASPSFASTFLFSIERCIRSSRPLVNISSKSGRNSASIACRRFTDGSSGLPAMLHAAMEKQRGLRLLALGQFEICRLEFSDGQPLETMRSCSAKEQPLCGMTGSQTVVFVLVLRVSTADIMPRWRRYRRHIRAYNTRGNHGTGQTSRWSRLYTSSSRIL